MTEKVIHEVRFIETDDGFRIEVKGDKEHLRRMGFGPGMWGFGFSRQRRRRFGRRFGPWGHFGRRHGHHRHGPHGPHRHGGWGKWGHEPDGPGPEKGPQSV